MFLLGVSGASTRPIKEIYLLRDYRRPTLILVNTAGGNNYFEVPGTWYQVPGIFFNKKLKNVSQLWVRPIEWFKLNFASCVVQQTRSLDVLILYFICNTWYGFCELNLRYDY